MSQQGVEEADLDCPYCGEPISVLIDTSHLDAQAQQYEEQYAEQYIEDCQVCCRPIRLQVRAAADGSVAVQGFHENDT